MVNMENIEKTSPVPSWQQELQSAFTDIPSLLAALELGKDKLNGSQLANNTFPLLVTNSYVQRMKKGDRNDPLLRQVLPVAEELSTHPLFLCDPVGDSQASALPGLIHKYHGRVLVITTGACAIHCRYCFRREFPYANNSTQRSKLGVVTQYLSENPDVTELILSGGDPLTLSDSKFNHLFTRLSTSPQIKRIRIHTRLPIVLPSRVTKGLLNTLCSSTKKVVVVIHANHPNELSDEVADVLRLLKNNNVTLLNQTVLLRGINDNAKTLIALSERLFECHTLPYYLHLLDKVNGAMHFDSSLKKAYKIHAQMQKKLPGYLVPKLVCEEAGQPHKIIL